MTATHVFERAGATLYLDVETFSEIDLKTAGAHKYASACEVLVVQIAVNDGAVEVWDLTAEQGCGKRLASLQRLIDGADTVVIHNSAFERNVLAAHGVTIPLEKIDDTMVNALAHGLPGKLEELCVALGLPEELAKMKEGRKLITLFTKPRPKNMKVRRATKETHPDEWQQFLAYAERDVVTLRAVHARTPRWNCTRRERDYWFRDQAINDRGFAVDTELAEAAIRAAQRTSRTLAAATAEITNGVVGATTQRDKLLAHLKTEFGLDLPDMTGDTVDYVLRSKGLHPDARRLLEIRKAASATTPSKYRALLGAVSDDGRLRGALQFCGAARTGRDAGRIFQPQNLVRTPDWFGSNTQASVVEALKADNDDAIEVLCDPIEAISFCVRGSLVPSPGCVFCVADLSNIEGRVLAWGAGETWKIEAFKAFDRGEGPDLYKVTAGRILGKDPKDVTKQERQEKGKVPELAGGYQGSVGAYRRMGGETFEKMSDDEILDIVRPWRKQHPRTVDFWYDVERAARSALQSPGDQFRVRDMVAFDVVHACGRDWLRMRLPSGRYLCYAEPKLERDFCTRCEGTGTVLHPFEGVERELTCPTCGGSGEVGSPRVSYMGVDQNTRKWTRQDTYGGKLVENWTQAVARDVFFAGLHRAMDAGFPVVLRVHDELVAEVPIGSDLTHEKLAQLMATNDSWNAGLPLAAAGSTMDRYRKD